MTMKGFLEQYGVGIFVLIVVAILLAFASPFTKNVKATITNKIDTIKNIGDKTLNKASRQVQKKIDPTDVYAVLYKDGELVLSAHEITPNRACINNYKLINQSSVPWKSNNTNIKTVTVMDTIAPTTCMNWFFGCNNLTEIKNIDDFNMSNVTSTYWMFQNCKSITSLDLSYMNTQSLTNTAGMFYGCAGLTNLDVSNFNTRNTINMSYMFYGCQKLTSLDLTKFDTSNVSNMSYMFKFCGKLPSLDVSNFDTTKCTNMNSMFYGCSLLTELDLSSFDTNTVSNMSQMFRSCSKLTTIKGGSKWKTADKCDNMFNSCGTDKIS